MGSNMDVGDAFDALSDTDLWIDAAALLAGFAGAAVSQNILENRVSLDLPDEVYGLVVVAGAEVAPAGDYTRPMQLGGAGHTGLNVAGRTSLSGYLPEV